MDQVSLPFSLSVLWFKLKSWFQFLDFSFYLIGEIWSRGELVLISLWLIWLGFGQLGSHHHLELRTQLQLLAPWLCFRWLEFGVCNGWKIVLCKITKGLFFARVGLVRLGIRRMTFMCLIWQMTSSSGIGKLLWDIVAYYFIWCCSKWALFDL